MGRQAERRAKALAERQPQQPKRKVRVTAQDVATIATWTEIDNNTTKEGWYERQLIDAIQDKEAREEVQEYISIYMRRG